VVVIFCTAAVANGLTTELLHGQRAHAELIALTDELTTLPNRRFAERLLDREFAAALRGRPLTVAIFDIDNFKEYNDRFGHAAGDRALVTFAELLKGQTRLMDISARHGGEEFLTVLSACELEGGLQFVERVRTALQRVDFIAGPITVSVGVAAFRSGMNTYTELLAAADRALYLAKQEGRDCVRAAAPEWRIESGIEIGSA
jgi:diguanylate cyclase (GGDEF)-like protein